VTVITPHARAGQFFRALGARRRPPDLAAARAVLPPPLFDLFARMPVEDQRHGLAVLGLLRAGGQSETVLLQAGLLHDVGKADGGVGLHHRVARVLLRAGAPPAWRWLAGTPTGWRRPFWVVAHHPDRGAAWIEAAGGAPGLVALVRYHERRPPAEWAGTDLARWHAELARADARD
jgi:hypothetical protein